jgi:hypothetical protein
VFEFHGWAVIRVSDLDDPPLEVIAARERDAAERARTAIRDITGGASLFQVARTSNEMLVLLAHGLKNHRSETAVDLFRWLANELPESYGLLYVRDDEDHERGGDYENCFRLWRLARGRLDELGDPFLSPCIPAIEAPWEPPSDV